MSEKEGEATADALSDEITDQKQNKRPASEIVTDEGNLTYIKYNIGLLAIVGGGFGLTGGLGARFFAGGGDAGAAMAGGIFMIAVFAVMALSGPILSVFIGLQFSRQMRNTYEAIVSSFASGVAGYFAMMITGVLITMIIAPSGGGGAEGDTTGNFFNLGDVLLPLIVMAIPVGLVAAGIVYFNERVFGSETL